MAVDCKVKISCRKCNKPHETVCHGLVINKQKATFATEEHLEEEDSDYEFLDFSFVDDMDEEESASEDDANEENGESNREK